MAAQRRKGITMVHCDDHMKAVARRYAKIKYLPGASGLGLRLILKKQLMQYGWSPEEAAAILREADRIRSRGEA